ncbi:MAG: type II toxin-antitoxin system VapC family toxin [Deltaproteobacteria bacterium]|nr:type II toxin-antitoxin system VapC family toxin [Deltaproteobacteria bacterium]
MYLLDTNIISYWMRGDKRIIDRIKKHSPAELSLSTITLAEILYGIEKSPVKKKERRLKIEEIASLLNLYSFDEAAARKYAFIRAQLEREGTVISERDTQIASIAMANKLAVVTHNVKEFDRIAKLKVEDWATEQKRGKRGGA